MSLSPERRIHSAYRSREPYLAHVGRQFIQSQLKLAFRATFGLPLVQVLAIYSGLKLMRFLMLNWRDPHNPLSGGAERVTQAYLAALAERGHEAWWFANSFEGAAREDSVQGIRIVRGGGRGSSVLSAVSWYRSQKPFDLVIDQHHGIPWYAPWWCRTNCISYIHEVLGPIWRSFYPWPISSIGRTQERWTHWLYRNVPFWVGCESAKRSLQEHSVRDVTIISYGINTQAVPELEPKPLRVPVELIAVSRLAPNQRVDHAVRVAKVLLQRGVETHLIVVGSGEVEGDLKQLADQLELGKAVTFTGQIKEEEKNALMRRAHLLVHTSVREGWGLNVTEANAMGTPAIVYPVPGLVDSTLHNETGIVTREETPESIADGVAALLQTPVEYERLRRNAWERAKTFHWSYVLPRACDWLEGRAKGKTANGRR